MKRVFYMLIGILISINLYAQQLSPEVKASAGDYYSNANGSISFTIGEAIVETISDGTNTLTQGFQQPNYKLSTIEENGRFDIQLNLFPNPLVEGFTIDHNCTDCNFLQLIIYDINGQLLVSKELSAKSNYISLSPFAAGIYMVHIYSRDESKIAVYKIQKLINR